MSALSKMAAKISASKMPPPAPRKSKSNSESERVITTESDAIGITYKPSDSIVASSPGPSQGDLKKFRPFAPISPFSGPRDVNGKPDVTSLEGIDIPTEPLKIFANRGFLSKHQLPISQWYMHTSYLATVVDKQSMIPVSANIDETPRRAKHEDVLDYVYDWAAWAAEIRDEARRTEVLGWVTRALERVLKEGMERTGMLLTPNDVSGTKSGMKKAPEGEVNIQVIITSSIKEKPVKKLDKLAMQKTNDNVAKSNQAKTGVAAGMPSEPAPELLVSIEEASKASLMKAKRVANEMDPADVEQDAKRQKLDNEASKNIEAPIANATDLQQQPTTLEKFSRSTSESMSPAEEEKRTRYLQQIFQPRVNHILKKAGLSQTRGKCKNWDTVKTRLTEAGVSVKYRNIMLKDFCSGHSAWNGDSSVDPNEELALYAHGGFKSGLGKASAGTDNKVDAKTEENGVQPNMSDTATLLSALESMPVLNTESPIPDTFVPAQPLVRPAQPVESSQLDPKVPKKLIITLRTFPGFDPEDYSLYNQYQHENFMFTFTRQSTVTERVRISETLISEVDALLDASINEKIDGSPVLDSKRQFIRNERGRIVATGNFVDLNSDYMVFKGLADAQKPWIWKGRMLTV